MKYTEIEHLLPWVFQRTITEGEPHNPLLALLQVMDQMQAPDEAVLDHLETYVNPYSAPERFVPFLARMVNQDRFLTEVNGTPQLPSGAGYLRELIAASAQLSKWRGTKKGLLLFLQTATGLKDFSIEDRVTDAQGKLRPFHLRINAPPGAAPYQTMLTRIIESEKPAWVTWELRFVEP